MQLALELSLPSLLLSGTLGLIGLYVTMICCNLGETNSLLANFSKGETWALQRFLEDTYLDLLPTLTTAAVVGLDSPRGTAFEQN